MVDFFFSSGTIPSFGYLKGRGWRRTRPADSHLRRRTLPRLRAARLLQARARTAMSGMTRNSSTLPLSLPTLPVHPSPTKTRDYLHLNPTLPRTTHSSSCRLYHCPGNNNGPSAWPPPPSPPLNPTCAPLPSLSNNPFSRSYNVSFSSNAPTLSEKRQKGYPKLLNVDSGG